jgi:chorismate mutase
MDREQPPAAVRCLGVRGAVTARANSPEAILSATGELLAALVEANGIEQEDVGAVFFTTTPDLTAAFPAVAARQLGWVDTAFLCGHEMDVPGGPPRVIRVMILWNTALAKSQIEHVYLGDARQLRPDRSNRVSSNGRQPAFFQPVSGQGASRNFQEQSQ